MTLLSTGTCRNVVNARDFVWPLVSFPEQLTVVFDLGTKLHVRISTRLENGVLRNGQQSGSAVNNFLDQGKFEALKMLSGLEAVMSISFMLKSRWVLEPFSSYRCLTSSLKKRKNLHFRYRTLSRLAVFREAFGRLWVLLIKEALQEEDWTLKKVFSVFVAKFYDFFNIARRRHPYIESVLCNEKQARASKYINPSMP